MRLPAWLPLVTRQQHEEDLNRLWAYVLRQTDHITLIGERVTQLEDSTEPPSGPDAA